MICISIAQESRRMALVDMLNASRQCDLIEFRLDRFSKAPDFSEILENKPKPIIFSCRRPQDGGDWQGSETDRLAILRQCIISKADFVEIEHDVADQIRPLPPCKRVISYTNLQETPSNIAEIYAELQTKKPDIIKLTTLARTPEEAWPLLQIINKPALPTVVMGIGKPAPMLAVLGKMIGSPWTYAALERGMEAYPGQPTVHDLNFVYHYPKIDKKTRLIGVLGFTEMEYVTVALLNKALAELKFKARCLPLQIGSKGMFLKVINAIRLGGVVVNDEHRGDILELAKVKEPACGQAQSIDLLLHQDDVWQGYNLLFRAGVASIEATLRERQPSDKPLENKTFMIVGTNPAARSIALGIKMRGGIPIIAARDRNAAQALAKSLGCRFIAVDALYSTLHDVLVVCSEEKLPKSKGEEGIRAGFLKEGMTVFDLTALPRKSKLLREAEARGCGVVTPHRLILETVNLQIQMMTSQVAPRDKLEAILKEVLPEEE